MSHDFQYDIFLSHSSKDKLAVRELAERLKGDGLRVWLDEWEIKPGDSISLKIEQGLESSRTLILVMSSDAFASDWVTLERHTALFRDPTSQQRRFIPLRLDDAPLKDILKQFSYIDWREKDETEYLRLLGLCLPSEIDLNKKNDAFETGHTILNGQSKNMLTQMDNTQSSPEVSRIAASEPSKTEQSPPEFEPLRYQQTQFVGREQELRMTLDALRCTKPPRILCIDGLGGIGKTALAEEVVRRSLAEGIVTALCWKTAKVEGLLGPQRKRLHDPIAWRSIRSDFLRAKERRGERFLFVLDNLETTEGLEELIVEFPDVVGSHAGIVTSRERLHWHPAVQSISLKGLTQKDSIQFLRIDSRARSIHSLASASEDDLRRIAEVLEGSPLAMKLVVGLCEYLSIESVLDRLLEARLDKQSKGGSLYTFIYLDAWRRLSELAKLLLIYAGKTTQETLGELEIKAIFTTMGYPDDEIHSAITKISPLI